MLHHNFSKDPTAWNPVMRRAKNDFDCESRDKSEIIFPTQLILVIPSSSFKLITAWLPTNSIFLHPWSHLLSLLDDPEHGHYLFLVLIHFEQTQELFVWAVRSERLQPFWSLSNHLSTSNIVKITHSMVVLLRETIMEDKKQVVLKVSVAVV